MAVGELPEGRFAWWAGRMRDGLAVAGVLAPIVLVAGVAADLHEVAWFVWYGGFTGLPWREAAGDAPGWLGWAGVAGFAVAGWRRTAAVLAWVAAAGLVAAMVFRVAVIGGWLALGVVAAVALTFSSEPARLPARRVGGVVLVLFARVLGHQFGYVDVLAWVVLAAVVGWVVWAGPVRTRWRRSGAA